jgi:zeaxanthin glucosyltransferase
VPTIVLLIYHGHGHFNACFRLAKTLQSEFRIVFAGHIFFNKYVQSQGFTFHALRTVPFGLGFEKWVNTIEKKKNIQLQTLKDRWHNRLFKLRQSELNEMVDTLTPDYIFIDSWQSTDFIVLYPKLKKGNIRVLTLHTMLSTKLESGIPPLNSSTLPSNKLAVMLSMLNFKLAQFTKQALQWLRYFGKNDSSMVALQIEKNHIPKKYFYKKGALFSIGIDCLDEIILVPSEFEFPLKQKTSLQHYLGFMSDNQRLEIADESFKLIFKKIEEKLTAGSRLIYCSFGTVEQKNKKATKRFLSRLVEVARSSEHVFLFAGTLYNEIKEINISNNVFFVSNAPQLFVLQHASLFITHGGLNSAKEAILAEVPMLVYPNNDRTDNNGVSSRIVFHNLGLRGNIKRDTADDIQSKMKKLMTDHGFKENIKKMKPINDSYNDQKIFDIIRNLKPLD